MRELVLHTSPKPRPLSGLGTGKNASSMAIADSRMRKENKGSSLKSISRGRRRLDRLATKTSFSIKAEPFDDAFAAVPHNVA